MEVWLHTAASHSPHFTEPVIDHGHGQVDRMDSISLASTFTGFLKIQSSSRSIVGFTRNMQKCNSEFALMS